MKMSTTGCRKQQSFTKTSLKNQRQQREILNVYIVMNLQTDDYERSIVDSKICFTLMTRGADAFHHLLDNNL